MLLPSTAFVRAARRLNRRDPDSANDLRIVLELLAENALDPRLKSHKLKGQFAGSWACSVGYDLRIVFQFVKHGGKDAILLEAVGTHDEVY